MKEVLILKGLPASGKTSYAQDLQVKHPGKWKRVNKDDLRAMLDAGVWSKHNEKFILIARDVLIVNALEDGFSVIVDDTNLFPKHEGDIRELVKDVAQVRTKFFDVGVDECVARDAVRQKPVGEKVIRDMYDKYLKPAIPNVDPMPINDGPWIVLCDIDGTVALHGSERGHFEYDKVGNDRPNLPIVDLVHNILCGPSIDDVVFLSGREDRCRDITLAWLAEQNFWQPTLYMRTTGDHRKDATIKRELFDTHIRGKYNVAYVLEDRDQCVALWRSLGLTCLQVANGNF